MTKTFTAMALPLGLLLSLLTLYHNVFAQTPQPGFASVVVSNQWNEVVGLTFTHDGVDMFVWERGGRVYVVTGGTKRLVLDISEEVGAWHDHGLLGFALHPQFDQNGYIYLLYLVDRHHLINFGTGAYNPTVNEYSNATIGRLTRYTLNKAGGIYTVAGGSRKILFGDQRSNGIIVTERSHSTGSLVFGTDQTLLVSTGDGANVIGQDAGSAAGTYFVQALADGILTPELNVGAYRSQVLDCYNGKILRIDPETGEGIPSNPFYDPTRPNSAVSKVWALGLRNPFRMSFKPGSGSHNPNDANPGILYVGDVGYYSWEEIDVVDKPGMNFGWPIYEGLVPSPAYTNNTPNPFAPNPLFQVNGCNQQYFYFQNLIKQETPDGTAVFTNPCGGQSIPSTIPTFVHTRPIIDWAHNAAGPSRTGTFSGQTATVTNIGAAGSPVSGSQFGGSAAVGGVYYTGTDFPEEYRNKLFFGDYGYGWIRNIALNDQEEPVQVRPFINSGSVVVGMATHPTQEGLYYVNFPSEIRRVVYSSNRPPIAVASANHISGASPLNVQFKGDDSNDPEAQPLSYQWNFGDGSPLSNVANPAHTFTTSGTAPTQFTVTLRVTDNQGLQDQTTMTISVNNSPPNVTITSPLHGTLYPLTGETIYPLRAAVADLEHSANQLSYKWQTTLHHEQHSHPEPVDTSPETTTHISPVGCDGETYFVIISLTVTDAAGLSTTKTVTLFPDCSSPSKITPLITWPDPAPIIVGTPLSATQLNSQAIHEGSPVPGTFTYTPSSGTVLPVGNSQELAVTFTPTNTTLFNTTSKVVTIHVNAVPKVTPLITWPNPAAIGVGTPLSSTQLNATASHNGSPVPGVFVYTPDAGTILDVGAGQELSVTFTPTNTTAYNPVNKTVTIDITKAVPLITWSNPAPIAVGTALSSTQLNAIASHNGTPIPGSYIYTPPAGTVLSLGTGQQLSVSFTPADPSVYLPATKVVTIDVNQNVGPVFYRAVNINGPALVIDGNNWISSTGAPNFFFTTNNTVMANQGITLVPPTDANRATMIRSSVYGNTVTLNMTAVPSGNYQVWLYVWEDNFAQTYSVSVEGSVVLSNFNSGSAGVWRKLGPYPVNITDGAINVSSSGGQGNFSGIEVWTVGSPPGNQPPVVANPIADQNATAGVAFSYAFPANTFSDPNAGTTLTYTAALEGGGSLPGWLTFTGSTRTFSGTPALANLGSINIRVTASDGAPGGTVSDVFALNVTEATKVTPTINWSNPAPIAVGTALSSTQLNATASYNGSPVAGSFVYTPPSGTVLGLGTAQQLSVSFTPTNTVLYNPASKTVTIDVNESAPSTFYRAININGPALVIDGNNWISSTGAPNFSFTTNRSVSANQNVTLIPPTDANRATMIRSFVWGSTVSLNMTSVPSGNYQVWVYVWEDNSPETYSISLEGSVVQSNYNSGPGGTWRKLGPYPVNITDGAISVSSSGGFANLSGMEVWTLGSPPANQPPVVANPIADQNATAGVAFSYAFPANTFSDPNAGTTLTYTAALEGGGSLPGWLTFTGSTRTFSGTPALANLGSINIRVTASDGAPGGTVSDVFALNVTEATKVTPTINWSNPAPIAVGTALSSTQLNATASYNGSPVAGTFVYTPPSGTVLGLGTGQQLSVSFTPTNTLLYNAASATVTIDVNETVQSTFYRAININGPALVIDGNNWISSTGAPNFSFTTSNSVMANQGITLVPPTDANRATMIRSSVWGSTVTLNMTAVPSGNYQVWLYVWEDNFAQTYSVSLEGSVVLSNFNSGTAGVWRKLGPYPVNITDGAINVSSMGGHANLSGIEVWTGTSGAAARTSAIARTATLAEETADNSAALEANPNPFSTKLNVRFTARQSTNARVELFDLRGRSIHLVYSGNMSAGETKEKELETSELPDGIYILRFVNGKHVSHLKVMGVQ